MMNKVFITRAATITALADNLEDLWQRLLCRQSAVQPINRFSTDSYYSHEAACIDSLRSDGNISLVQPLIDRLLENLGSVPVDTFLITATTKSGIDTLERLKKYTEADKHDILLSYLPKLISHKLNLNHQGININAACASSTIAVAKAASLIAAGRISVALVVGIDILTEFIFSGFSALRVLSPTTCKPFDKHRDGLNLGEGAAALLLMNEQRAKSDGITPIASLIGWGIATDATHIIAPDINASGLIHAIRLALKKANVTPENIAGINAHGTGTFYNDLMEFNAFQAIFKNHMIPIHSVKGAIGHTLGAAGAIEIAIGIQSLIHQIIPPTVGFNEPEQITATMISNSSVQISGNYLLKVNSGFGGINSAIILGKGDSE
ncbi:MAG: beta-ketoacyl-[acyl-carrier-protein] synthase family protein [Desulfobacterales bacterium]|nr:beta-ketoacyl-[acyl-carrier-protein] synthase family protein [Desulfobacterales bacterium]